MIGGFTATVGTKVFTGLSSAPNALGSGLKVVDTKDRAFDTTNTKTILFSNVSNKYWSL